MALPWHYHSIGSHVLSMSFNNTYDITKVNKCMQGILM